MKRLNFNIKDRKVLTLGLCLILVCIFSLTIAYAALNAVLTISGNAEITASTWNIYLNNPRVKNGSATTDVPTISGNTLNFNTTLNMPGDYYEFVVDVVNRGSIDAMIENVIKTPELTAAQAKYLKYEITYQNGASINSKQLLAKETSMPIKVRIEYRKDLTASDLPSGQVVLDLSLTLEYIQSDGSGSSVNNNGEGVTLISANGSLDATGTIVTIGDQQFYTIGTDGDNVKLLSMYNLYVGNSVDKDWNVTPLANPTGKQSELAKGWSDGESEWYGTTAFSNTSFTYAGSIVEEYVNTYKNILETDYNTNIVEARLITYDELTSIEIGCSEDHVSCGNSPSWIYSTSYWSGSANDGYGVWDVYSDGRFCYDPFDDVYLFGVRPVIVIPKSQIIESDSLIDFTVDGVTYYAEDGMIWEEWINSKYNYNDFVSFKYNSVYFIRPYNDSPVKLLRCDDSNCIYTFAVYLDDLITADTYIFSDEQPDWL